jgi:hypothetical protein
LLRPSSTGIAAFIDRQRGLPFSYPRVGATRDGDAPAEYVVDHPLARIGRPVSRALQRRFARDSLRAMDIFCASAGTKRSDTS